MAAWNPSPEGMEQLLGLFKASQSADNATHRAIQQQLTSFNAIPDYNNYLAYIFNQMRGEAGSVRQMAGLVLKNNVKEHWSKVHPDVQGYVHENLLGSIGDPEPYIRTTAGSCITTITASAGLEAWPQLVPTLYQMLDSTDTNQVDGAFSALAKICEDSSGRLAADAEPQPLNFLIPKFISFFQHQHEPFRKYALACVNQFVLMQPEPLKQNMPQFLHGLSELKGDPSAEVRKRVCQALVMLLEVQLEMLMPNMSDIIQYMLQATADDDELVSLEACEFWSGICETKVAKEALGPFVPQLVPVLLKGMVYSEVDLLVLGAEDEDDEQQPDRPEDIRPRFHRSRFHGGSTEGGGAGGDDDEDEDEEEDDGDDDAEVAEWNLRKCSASGLDILAGTFREAILPTLLPLLQERLASSEWEIRESGILALGAIAEGCIDHIAVYLPQLTPWLIQTLSDSKPLVRSITCWTLSRYSKWVVEQPSPETYLRPLMEELLKRVLDHNKKVQEAACSSFATLEEEAQLELVPYLEPILRNLIFAFSKYQARNLLILYDAIGTLADAVGSELDRPQYVSILMPPLIERWSVLRDDDKGLFPLLECFTSIAQALGVGFQQFAEPVFTRCLRIVQGSFEAEAQARQGGQEPIDKEFVVCALDLISGMTEGMGESFQGLVAASALPQLLLLCMRDETPDVRQSAFALVGDLAKACYHSLLPVLAEYLPVLTEHLNPDFVSVCNNASWAIGEITVKVSKDISPYVAPVLQRLIPIINKPLGQNKSLIENTAITIGRLGMAAPQLTAAHFVTFAQAWCTALKTIRDDVEKEHAFIGMCEMIKINPQGPISCLLDLFEAIASWGKPPDALNTMFGQIVLGYKGSIPPEQWNAFHATFPEHLSKRLAERYQL
mmetsp:Transcript_74295/g.124000  ORF Transcript_74295/g.124000 Transcript_74295/m.124000 type:complete len:895 (+) Transcript_74295:39-2723(+)|eukprot:CAMPEP_0119310652 /NCGR_PEP_ID=MMETSP1333-20130426/19691_1 /TAXON_ID=418940 /ORGANISM="Scyphosphaera apsteinii, Strain RCC1455" /LENGTH=894 /DNA_ID=CAMNT_0007314871 /DNA_START=33 /DNA_END=2717 /DNA_ORIENTATION=-